MNAAITIALVRPSGLDCYGAFDDDFDRTDDLTRLDAAVDPYAPE